MACLVGVVLVVLLFVDICPLDGQTPTSDLTNGYPLNTSTVATAAVSSATAATTMAAITSADLLFTGVNVLRFEVRLCEGMFLY